MIVADALRQGRLQLVQAGVEDAARDARLLMAAALDVGTERLTLCHRDEMSPAQSAAFAQMVASRAGRAPVSRILGRRAFYGRDFIVTPDVLDPRPDTERLVEVALDAPFAAFADLGTGSGCIALTLLAERRESTAIATDISAGALATARDNARALGLADRIHFRQSDWFQALEGQFDLIVSNPPYIAPRELGDLAPEVARFDPRIALFDTDDGLAGYRRITAGAPAVMRPGGRLAVEIGWSQAAAVTALFRGAGFGNVAVFRDLGGRDRVVCGHWPG